MASSFVAGIDKKVEQQIKVREKRFGKSVKTDKELTIIHGNCPWVVLRSGIDAPVHDNERFMTFPRCTSERPYVTNDWAKKTVLAGELQDRSGETFSRPHGIQTIRDNVESQQRAAYTITGTQGHRPISGITGFTVTSKDTWGMIMEADIKIKCWSKDDLDKLDRVYFKPGYTALLEWGHTLYFREDDTECITPTMLISDEEFFKGGEYIELDHKVIEGRKQDSNKEALFGYITNFSFSLNKDGSYDCSLKMLSKGSVIRGLKIKGTTLTPESESSGLNENSEDDRAVDYEDISIWHKIHQAFIDFGEDNNNPKTEPIEDIDEEDDTRNYGNLPPRIGCGSGQGQDFFNGLEALRKGRSNKTVKKFIFKKRKKTILFNSGDLDGLHSFPVIAVPVKVRKDNKNKEFYITLRSLLYLINYFNSDGRIRFNLWDKSTYVDPRGTEDNPSVSFNPYVAVKPKQAIEYNKLYAVEVEKENFWKLILETDGRGENSGRKIQNIWINFDQFVLEVEHQLASKVEDYTILDVLQSFLGRIQKAFGNVNEFQVVVDHKNGDSLFTVIDSKCIRIDSAEEVPEIQVTGLDNTVSDLKITSEISSDIANEMSIAAQAPRTYEDGSESVDESMVHWGENCVNRWYIKEEDIESSKNENTKEDLDALAEKERRYRKNKEKWLKKLKKEYKSLRSGKKLKNTPNDNSLETESFKNETVLASSEERFQDLQLNAETYIQEQVSIETTTYEDGPNLQMGIIPIRVGLTMMGIGNLTIGNVFRIKSGVLLDKYNNWAQIITGIEHNVTKAGWTTTLKTQYYPLYYGDVRKKPATQLSYQAEVMQEDVIQNAEITGISTNYRDPRALSNDCGLYTAMTKHTGYTWTGKSRHQCARYTAAWARAYAKGKEPLYAEPSRESNFYGAPPQSAGGNASQEGHVTELKSYGYREAYRKTGASTKDIGLEAAKCSEGDVLIYYNSAGKMHSQFLSDRGWVSDFPQESGCVYGGGSGYTIIHLKAPKRHSDWECSA